MIWNLKVYNSNDQVEDMMRAMPEQVQTCFECLGSGCVTCQLVAKQRQQNSKVPPTVTTVVADGQQMLDFAVWFWLQLLDMAGIWRTGCQAPRGLAWALPCAPIGQPAAQQHICKWSRIHKLNARLCTSNYCSILALSASTSKAVQICPVRSSMLST